MEEAGVITEAVAAAIHTRERTDKCTFYISTVILN